jgi:hypothetical protein
MKQLLNWFQRLSKAVSTKRKLRTGTFRPGVEFLEDRLVPSLVHGSGPVLQQVQVETLFLGQQWQNDSTYSSLRNNLNDFLQNLTGSSYMDLMSQYGVGHGSFIDTSIGFFIPDPNMTENISDAQIQTFITFSVNDGSLKPENGERLFVVFTAPGEVVVDSSGKTSRSDFAAYHSDFVDGSGVTTYYAVIAFPGSPNGTDGLPTTMGNLTAPVSHELAEAVTDPIPPSGWTDPQNSYVTRLGPEIGDIADAQNARSVMWNGYYVQPLVDINDQVINPTLPASGSSVTVAAGSGFSGVVATFTDNSPIFIPPQGESGFTVSISWGDGTETTGSVVSAGNGTCRVLGNHTYLQSGLYAIGVQVTDQYGIQATASTSATVTAPDLTPDEHFVRGLYSDFLGRPGTRTELDGWVSLLPGLGPEGVAAGIIRSEEALKRVVDSFYHTFLARPADSAGEQGWVNYLEGGGTEEVMLDGFLSTPEFANVANRLIGSADADSNFVQALYILVLERPGQPSEITAWLNLLPRMGRAGVADAFDHSVEFRTGALRTLYGDPSLPAPIQLFFPDLLRRHTPPSAGEVSGWATSPYDMLSVEGFLAASSEYYSVQQPGNN